MKTKLLSIIFICLGLIGCNSKEEPTKGGKEKPNAGYFSVSENKRVKFAPGNVQYVRSTSTWKFANKQTSYIGEANATGDVIDLFCWSEESNNYGIDTTDTSKPFVDWGMAFSGNWRTLSIDEWIYVFDGRKDAPSLMAAACVDGVNGFILLPDGWSDLDGISINKGNASTGTTAQSYRNHNNINAADWAKIEANGAVFLPAAGVYDGFLGDVEYCYGGIAGAYHSTYREESSIDVKFKTIFFYAGVYQGTDSFYTNIQKCAKRASVRLVQDVQ